MARRIYVAGGSSMPARVSKQEKPKRAHRPDNLPRQFSRSQENFDAQMRQFSKEKQNYNAANGEEERNRLSRIRERHLAGLLPDERDGAPTKCQRKAWSRERKLAAEREFYKNRPLGIQEAQQQAAAWLHGLLNPTTPSRGARAEKRGDLTHDAKHMARIAAAQRRHGKVV